MTTRTIGNWISPTKPAMPRETEIEQLRRLVPAYGDGGDGVEASSAKSELTSWRQAMLIAEYGKHLYEQAREV